MSVGVQGVRQVSYLSRRPLLSRCTMTAWLCLQGVSYSLPSEAGIAVASCIVIEMFS